MSYGYPHRPVDIATQLCRDVAHAGWQLGSVKVTDAEIVVVARHPDLSRQQRPVEVNE